MSYFGYSSEDYIKHLYEKAGTKFGDNYHDRVIERYV